MVPICGCRICERKSHNAGAKAKCMTPAWFVMLIWSLSGSAARKSWRSLALARPNSLFVQLKTTPRVLEGRRWLPTPLVTNERVCVIAALRGHRRHSAVRTIGAIICRSRPISVIIVAVVLSIASSYASNERTNHQCQCCDIFKNHTHDWVLFFGSLLLRQTKAKSDFLLVEATQQ